MTTEITEATFLRDIKNHQMTILRDDGIHRHIRYKKPGTGDMYFDIITWPWHLCYTGDMGTYVFSRLEDMFEFFRTKPLGEKALYINTGYWAEKVLAADKCSGIEQYSADKFREKILEILDDREAPEDLRNEVEEEVLSCADEGEYSAREAVDRFEYNGRPYFSDFWEVDLQEYTFRYVWCCYAIAWGIQQYDNATSAPEVAEEVHP